MGRRAVCLGALALIGCVHIPPTDQLMLYRGEAVLARDQATCGNGWLRIPPVSGVTRTLDPAGFRIMTWNLYKARAEGWREELARLGAGRDLILLQEAHLTPSFRSALEDSRSHWYMVRAFDLDGAETGVLTTGSAAPADACVARTAEPLIRLPKSALLTRYPLKDMGEELWVANLHGINFSLGTSRFGDQLEGLGRVLATHDGPLILAGDFNDWNLARRNTLERVVAGLGAQPLRLDPDERSRHLGRPVDHVFYRGLEVLEASAVQVSGSDHNPIRVAFRVSGPCRKGEKR